jgi:hypothetical protein
MAIVSTKDLRSYIEQHGGTLVELTNGNYDIRGPNGSANIGRPKNNRWDTDNITRGWGDATGIPKPKPGDL